MNLLLTYLYHRKQITTLSILPTIFQSYINHAIKQRNSNPENSILSHCNKPSKTVRIPRTYNVASKLTVSDDWVKLNIVTPKKIKVKTIINKWAKECMTPVGIKFQIQWFFNKQYRIFRKIQAAQQLKIIVETYAKSNTKQMKIIVRKDIGNLIASIGEFGIIPANINNKIITIKDCYNTGLFDRINRHNKKD